MKLKPFTVLRMYDFKRSSECIERDLLELLHVKNIKVVG